MVSWLPSEAPPRALVEIDFWQPKQVAEWLGDDPRWGQLSYVVVDELEQGVAGLVASPWPRVDERGRLHFGEEEDQNHVTVTEKDFLALLEERRHPIVQLELDEKEEQELKERALAIGDVFVARVRGRRGRPPGGGGPDGGAPVDPGRWIRGQVLDITAEARELAKVQTAAAVAGVVHDDYFELVGEELQDEDQGPPDTTPEGTPTPSGAGSGGAGGGVDPKGHTSIETRAVGPDRKAGASKELDDELTGKELHDELTKPARAKQSEDEDEEEGQLAAT